MSSSKKIAVLVHNDVLRDARVRKQARSLVAAGHKVDVFGFSLEAKERPSVIEGGANLKVEDIKINNFLMKVAAYVRSALNGNVTKKLVLGISVLTAFATFVLFLILVGLFAPGFLSWVPAILFLVLLGAAAGGAAVFRKRQYIEDWIKVHWGYGAIARALARNVIDKDYDVVHCHDMIAMLAGEMIKKKNPDITMIWDAHELYTELSYKTPYVSDITGQLIKRIAPRVDRMITISQSFIDFYAQHYPKLPRAEMVMNATRRPQSADMDQTLLRTAAGVNEDQKVLLFQGGVGPYRGVELLLEAADKLPPAWSVVFMGCGPLQDKIEAAAKVANKTRPKGAPSIAFIPPAPQEVLRDWTSGADLGIIPYENTSKNHLYCTPNKLWEYPNARVPILATDLVEMGRIISENGTGLLLPRDFKASDIVSAIESITDAQLKAWQENCDHFNETENWEKFEPNLLKAYI